MGAFLPVIVLAAAVDALKKGWPCGVDGNPLSTISAFARFQNTRQTEAHNLLEPLFSNLPLLQMNGFRNHLKRVLAEYRIVPLHKKQ